MHHVDSELQKPCAVDIGAEYQASFGFWGQNDGFHGPQQGSSVGITASLNRINLNLIGATWFWVGNDHKIHQDTTL